MVAESTAEDEARAGLEARFPGWRIWYVRCFDGSSSSVIWCAQFAGHVANAGSPEALAEALWSVAW